MSWSKGLVLDQDAGWQKMTVSARSHRPQGWAAWLRWGLGVLARLIAAVVVTVAAFVAANQVVTVSVVPSLWLASIGLPWVALGLLVLFACGYGAWFWYASDSFDVWVCSPLRAWWHRMRYRSKWANVMAVGGLTVTDRKRRELAPRLVRVRQDRFADVLTVRLPDGVTSDAFAELLPMVAESMRAREARVLSAPRRRVPRWLQGRLAREFAAGDTRPGVVFLRLAYGDPLVHVVPGADLVPGEQVDLSAVRIGRRDDGRDWLVDLLGTHVLLAGATGAEGLGVVVADRFDWSGDPVRAGASRRDRSQGRYGTRVRSGAVPRPGHYGW